MTLCATVIMCAAVTDCILRAIQDNVLRVQKWFGQDVIVVPSLLLVVDVAPRNGRVVNFVERHFHVDITSVEIPVMQVSI